MRTRFWKFILTIGIFILMALMLSLFLQLRLPAPTGPYPVGRTNFRWVDSSRPEVLTDDPGDAREVIALVWYPDRPGTGTQDGYFPGLSKVSQALRESGELEAWEVFGLQFIRSSSYQDAEPVKDQGPFPVVLLSPGNGTNVEFYASLAGEISSHGYIVVGIDHPYDVAAVELSNGSVAPYNKAQWSMDAKAHQAYTAERIHVRVADVLFALDQLDAMNADANSPFAGILNLNAVAVAGHSLGGITASEACKADARFKACTNLDGLQAGGPFSTDKDATPPAQPFLFLTKESQLPPKLIEKFESTSQSYWVVIHGATHESFTDGPQLQPSLLPLPNRADRLMTLIPTYTLAFLDQTLKGRSNSLLSEAVNREDVSVNIFPSR
jgi:Platelet-activating factor acetylhydrolase, isoform II